MTEAAASVRESIAKRIRDQREEHRWTQLDLASKSGLSLSAITKYESGAAAPMVDNIIKLSVVFGCTPNDLLGFR